MNDDKNHALADAQLKFTDEQFIWRFSPNRTDPEVLETIFVGREPLLQNVLEKVAESATTDAKHHVLLYGPRGIGKSHFTSLLHHRLSADKKLSAKIHIARLNEDETTTSLVQLLVRTYRSLCDAYPSDYAREWLDELLGQSPEEIGGVLTRRFVKRFEQRTLVVLVENLNLLFENLGNGGQQELRTLLQEHPFACLIATSQQLFKAVTDRSQPFFGFFQQIQLKPLSLEDAHDLLVKIASAKGQQDLTAFLDTPDGRSRVRAIHDLAGGNHRVYIVLSGFMTRETLDHLVVPFQKMADDLTPYYQERLRSISPQQRQIVELLCRERGTVNPKEMAKRLLASEQTIGKQVRKLAEIGYLSATKRGRETFYELSEPLMRLAYEVKEQSLLLMLVDFLRIWYRPDQLLQLRSGGLSSSTQEYADAAFERSQTHPDPRLNVLQNDLKQAAADGRNHELAAICEEMATVTNKASDWCQAGFHFETINKDYLTAIECCEKALNIDHKNAFAWGGKGILLYKLGRFEESIDCISKAIEIEPDLVCPWINKGNSLYELGLYEEAIYCDEKAIELDPDFKDGWNNKGVVLSKLGRYEEANDCYEKAIEIDPGFSIALSNKGTLLVSLGRYEEAIECLGKSIELDPKDAYPLFNRAEPLFALHRWDDGFEALRSAFLNAEEVLDYMGDAASVFSLIFRLSDDAESLQSRIDSMVDLYQQAADQSVSTSGENPLSYLGDGLVKSLAMIDASRVSSQVLESYVEAVQQRVADITEFEIPLRLFRYGIRYLISKDPSAFVELIQPERRIVHQALGLDVPN